MGKPHDGPQNIAAQFFTGKSQEEGRISWRVQGLRKMKTSLTLLTGVESEPLSVEDAKQYLRVVGTDDDEVIGRLVTSARKIVENEIGSPIGEQTFQLGLECFPESGVIEIPRPPLTEVLSVKYRLQDLTWRTLFDTEASPAVPTSSVVIETSGIPGTIRLRSEYSWPSDTLAEGFSVVVKFKAGITAEMDNLLTLIGMATAYMYEHRDEDGIDGVRQFVKKMSGLADRNTIPEMN